MIPRDGYILFQMFLQSFHLQALNFWAYNYLIANEAYGETHKLPEALVGGILYAQESHSNNFITEFLP